MVDKGDYHHIDFAPFPGQMARYRLVNALSLIRSVVESIAVLGTERFTWLHRSTVAVTVVGRTPVTLKCDYFQSAAPN